MLRTVVSERFRRWNLVALAADVGAAGLGHWIAKDPYITGFGITGIAGALMNVAFGDRANPTTSLGISASGMALAADGWKRGDHQQAVAGASVALAFAAISPLASPVMRLAKKLSPARLSQAAAVLLGFSAGALVTDAASQALTVPHRAVATFGIALLYLMSNVDMALSSDPSNAASAAQAVGKRLQPGGDSRPSGPQ